MCNVFEANWHTRSPRSRTLARAMIQFAHAVYILYAATQHAQHELGAYIFHFDHVHHLRAVRDEPALVATTVRIKCACSFPFASESGVQSGAECRMEMPSNVCCANDGYIAVAAHCTNHKCSIASHCSRNSSSSSQH